jgi:hypothetical protein
LIFVSRDSAEVGYIRRFFGISSRRANHQNLTEMLMIGDRAALARSQLTARRIHHDKWV